MGAGAATGRAWPTTAAGLGDGGCGTGTGRASIIVGNMSGVTPALGTTAGAPEPTALPHERQNFVSALFSVPQLTQITLEAAAGAAAGALPSGAAQLPQNLAPGRTSAPHTGQTLPACTGTAAAATDVPQLRQKRPEPASSAHFGHFICFLLHRF
ncbi:MAG TPA: hypothetical protein VNW47_03295 [Terriglobales bacterium]|nr:hypothetical protein [Terriglobales bacterium]